MKFQMAKNSLFAILLHSPWWASAAPRQRTRATGVVWV
jgi:hypothetical protein